MFYLSVMRSQDKVSAAGVVNSGRQGTVKTNRTVEKLSRSPGDRQ